MVKVQLDKVIAQWKAIHDRQWEGRKENFAGEREIDWAAYLLFNYRTSGKQLFKSGDPIQE